LPTNFTNENVAFQTGHPWFSILTRTGVFKGKENHEKFPADLVIPFVTFQTIFVDAYIFFYPIVLIRKKSLECAIDSWRCKI
jgi:hypothetical protein